MMRDGLAAGDRVQLHINNGRNKAYIRNGLDWIKRFPVGRSAASCPGRVKSAFGVRRAKTALSSGCKPHPATAPAGSNRSSHGGNEVAEAFD